MTGSSGAEHLAAGVDVEGPAASAETRAATRRKLNDLVAGRSYQAGDGYAAHMPVELYMQIASACNLDCYMCSEHNRPPEWRRGRGATSLPPELFDRVERELFPYAMRLTIGVGGEPMISPHFLDYVRRAHAAGLEVHVMTNGTRIRSDEAAETLARCAASLEISIDAARPQTYERIRRGSKWTSLMTNLERLGRQRRALSPEDRAHLTLCFVLMKSNVEEFPEFVELAARVGADKVAGWHVIPVTTEGREESLQDDRARSNEYLSQAVQRGRELGVAVDVPAAFPADDAQPASIGVPDQVVVAVGGEPAPPVGSAAPLVDDADEDVELEVIDHPRMAPGNARQTSQRATDTRPDSDPVAGSRRGIQREPCRRTPAPGRIACSSPSTSIFLFYDGRILPCCHPHSHASLPMGNLWEQSFTNIWNGHLYRSLRKGLFTGDAPPLCQSCSIVHSPPPRVEDVGELLAPGNDLAAWYGDRDVCADEQPDDVVAGNARLADDRVLDYVATLEDELSQTRRHVTVLEEERGHMLGHISNLERILRKVHGHTLYRIGSVVKDAFVRRKR